MENFELWVLLHRATDAFLRARSKELRRAAGISTVESSVLFVVKNSKVPVTPAEISRRILRAPHTVSELLTRMEKAGLIKKVKDLERKNLIRVILTDKGEDAYRRSREMETIHRMLSALTPEERQNMKNYLEKIRQKAIEDLGLKVVSPFPQ